MGEGEHAPAEKTSLTEDPQEKETQEQTTGKDPTLDLEDFNFFLVDNKEYFEGRMHLETRKTGRILFALDDGRLGELHLSGIGGEGAGPSLHNVIRRKALANYEWSTLDAPESEGGNAGYCTENLGPMNCVEGVKDTSGQLETTDSGVLSTIRRKKGRALQSNPTVQKMHRHGLQAETNSLHASINNIDTLFRIRAMQPDRSFFMVTDNGLTFEHLYSENMWLWLKHDHSSPIHGILGVYNGSLFVVDISGYLFVRERHNNGLVWVNCSAMEGGRKVVVGPPWDGASNQVQKVTAEDALFFVDRNGNLLQFTIKFISAVDTTFRSEDGGLVEFHWHAADGWSWTVHGIPEKDVILSTAPGPSFDGNQMFVIGSDGEVYSRYLDDNIWKWNGFGESISGINDEAEQNSHTFHKGNSDDFMHDNEGCGAPGAASNFDKGLQHIYLVDIDCDEKVAPVRPVPFSKDSVLFMLRDGRPELRKMGVNNWKWVRLIHTPTSHCKSSYLAASAS